MLPLCEREIPIIGDDYVDREFGSGAVKITPAHDFNDYAMGQRHKLPLTNILTPVAAINDDVPAAYRGLDRYDARKQSSLIWKPAIWSRRSMTTSSRSRVATVPARCWSPTLLISGSLISRASHWTTAD